MLLASKHMLARNPTFNNTKAFLKNLNRYATQTTTSESNSTVSSSERKVNVLTTTSCVPVSYINTYIQAGTRYQKNNLGIVEYLRNYMFQYTRSKTGLRIIRETELQGAELTCNATREYLVLRAKCFPRDVYSKQIILKFRPYFAELFMNVLNNSVFQEYLTKDIRNVNITQQLKLLSAEKIVFDQMHFVAFRNTGLGNPLFINYDAIPKTSQIKQFFEHTSSKNSLFIGVNVDKNVLLDYTKDKTLLKEENPIQTKINELYVQTKTKYYGGEHRTFANNIGQNSYLAVGFEGGAIYSKDYICYSILRAYLTGEVVAKWGIGTNLLAQTNNTKTKYKNVFANTYNLGYTDGGLFVLYLTAPHHTINKFATEVFNGFTKMLSSFGEKELKIAKNKAKMEFLIQFEDVECKADILANQVLINKI